MANYAKSETVTLRFEARDGDEHGPAYYPTELRWKGHHVPFVRSFTLEGSGYEYRLSVVLTPPSERGYKGADPVLLAILDEMRAAGVQFTEARARDAG